MYTADTAQSGLSMHMYFMNYLWIINKYPANVLYLNGETTVL